MDTPENLPQTHERLIGDLRLVIENAEELLKNTDKYTSALYQNARAKLALALNAANAELLRFEDAKLGRMIAENNAAPLAPVAHSGEARIMLAFQAH